MSNPEGGRRRSFLPNTNLEQISDWLTKTIVGVGLVQFREIGAALYGIGEAAGHAIGDIPGVPGSGTVFAISTIVGNFIGCSSWRTCGLRHAYTKYSVLRIRFGC